MPDFNAATQKSRRIEAEAQRDLRAGFSLISLSLRLYLPFCPFPLFSFLPRRKLFTRRILVAQDESGGYLLSIDRFWRHAKSFWLSLRGLTFLLIYPSLFLSLSPSSFRFSHLFHTVLISFSIPNRPAIASFFSSFIVLMRSLFRYTLYLTDAFSSLL